jgi:hypothetical protein
LVRSVLDRTPYRVEYYKDGEKQVIRRVPPPKLHDYEVGDEVTIQRKKGDDWDLDDNVEVKDINRKHPNVLTTQKSNGDYTFIPYDDISLYKSHLDGLNATMDGDLEDYNDKYLLWP